jgi:hypothetical protein
MKLPKGWKMGRLGDLVEIQEGLVSPVEPSYRDQPHVGADNILSGGGLVGQLKTPSELGLTSGKYPFRSGAIIYSKIRPYLNKVCRVDFDGVCSADAYPIYAKDSLVSTDFLVWSMRATGFLRQAIATSMRTGMPKVNRDDLGNIELLIPPLSEQRQIADTLNTWGDGLGKLDDLIVEKERCKKVLMRQVFAGKKRLRGFVGKWSTLKMGELIRLTIRPVVKPAAPFLSAGIRSHNRGVFLKPDFKPADIALDELFEMKKGDMVVNITFAWEGAIAVVPAEADGALVSHRFPTFEFRPKKAAVGFFRHLIATKRFVFHCGLASPGGAGRNRVLSKTELLKIAVSVPSFEEQTAIGEILDTCDEELRLLRDQRDALDRQKRGLMQQLLTGKLRVKTT